MTYQELLDEFSKKRMDILNDPVQGARYTPQLALLTWAMQSILEKLRDQEASKF